MDVPTEEIRIHNNITKSPGAVPSKYLVGILDASEERKQEKSGKLEKIVGGLVSIIGFLASLFFLSPNITGNIVFNNLLLRTSNLVGIIFLFIGLSGVFFYFRNKFR